MKKVTVGLFLLFGLAIVNESFAQRKTYVGLKSGYNLSTAYFFHSFYGSDINTKMESGFQGGIVAMNYLRNHVGLQAELLYTQKGWRQEFDDGTPDLVTELNYIELPLLVNIHTGKEQLHFFANAGCFVEYLLNSKQSANPTQENVYGFDESRDHKLGYGFRGGVGAFYDFQFGTLLFESSFSYSLSDVVATATFSVPCNLWDSAHQLTFRENWFFKNRFLKKMIKKVKLKHQQFPKDVNIDGIDDIVSFGQFDERYTAPLHGFKNSRHFYRTATSDLHYTGIRIPSLIVNAKNDPLLGKQCYPYKACKYHEYLHLETPRAGGHVGFFKLGAKTSWMDERALEFVARYARL